MSTGFTLSQSQNMDYAILSLDDFLECYMQADEAHKDMIARSVAQLLKYKADYDVEFCDTLDLLKDAVNIMNFVRLEQGKRRE